MKCFRRIGENLLSGIFVVCLAAITGPAHAQRTDENAVAEASDAFGTVVGREEVGLYSSGSARGFSPSEAGNLRIDGLYFDQVSDLVTHVARGSSVHVGISAQGFPFPAPTGIVDFHPRTPDDEVIGSALLGYASYGEQAYAEIDFQAPVIRNVLNIGAGVGYSRNSSYNIADSTDEWTAGGILRWQPLPSLTVASFWGMKEHREQGERQHVFIGDSGYPEFRGVDLMPQPWADYRVSSSNFGGIARYSPEGTWEIAVGVFHSERESPLNIDPLLLDTDNLGRGEYVISAAPPRSDSSTSGELRLTKRFDADTIRSTVHFRVTGRDRSGESGGADSIAFGPGTTSAVPQVERPAFAPGPTTLVEARQLTPGLAYEGVWRDVGQLSLGIQKSYYRRTVTPPGMPAVSARSTPWLYNIGAAAYVSENLAVYASYTKGFEEIGTAPLNAVNQGEAAPAQLTEQIDAGIRLQFHSGLQLVAGVFRIEKPYFDLDQSNVFRQVGNTRNSGIELSLAGNLTESLTVVTGVTLIDPEVRFEAGGSGSTSAVAVGPVPGLIRANFQYRVEAVAGLTLDAKVESTSARYARYDAVRLPPVTTVDAGVRYDTQWLGKDVTVRLKGLNLTNEYGLKPSASGKITPFDSRGFELSVAMDI